MNKLYKMIYFGMAFGSMGVVIPIIAIVFFMLKSIFDLYFSSGSLVVFLEVWSWSVFFNPWLDFLWSGDMARIFIRMSFACFFGGVFISILDDRR